MLGPALDLSLRSQQGGAALPSGLVGHWDANDYAASPRPSIRNRVSGRPVSQSLFSDQRRFFADSETAFWSGGGSRTVTDNNATSPTGDNDASTFVGSGNAFIARTIGLAAGTYTLAANVKNLGAGSQSFNMSGNSGTNSSTYSATTAWQRFKYTFTAPGGSAVIIPVWIISGSCNLAFTDVELFPGSADLGPTTPSGHWLLGSDAATHLPTVQDGYVDLTAGYGYAQFDQAADYSALTVVALAAKVSDTPMYNSLIAARVSEPTSGGAFGFMAAADISKAPGFYFKQKNFLFDRGTAIAISGLWDLYQKGYHGIATRWDGAAAQIFLDDCKWPSSEAETLSAQSLVDFVFGYVAAPTLPSGMRLAALALFNRALSDSEIRQAYAALIRKAPQVAPVAADRVYAAAGDSITNGFTYCYPYLFGPNANPTVYGANIGVSGWGLADIIADAPVTVDPIVPPGHRAGRKFILSLLIGRNDLHFYSGGAAQYAADLGTYFAARKAAGWTHCVLCTVLPATASGFNTVRNAFNAIVTANGWAAANHVDEICNFAADATMGPDAAASNTTYYADGTHPTNAGQVILESIIRPILNGL
jgi:hypothetical protein